MACLVAQPFHLGDSALDGDELGTEVGDELVIIQSAIVAVDVGFSPAKRPGRRPRSIPHQGLKSRRTGAPLRLNPDLVIDGILESLLTAQVPLGRLHRNMPQEELDLLQFAAGGMA